MLPIVLLSFFSFKVASDSVEDIIRSEQFSAAENVSQHLNEDLKQTVLLVGAVAAIPGTVEAVVNNDEFTLNLRLKAVTVSYPQIERAYVTRPDGILWSQYPTAPGDFARDFSAESWFTSIITENKTAISDAYVRPSAEQDQQFIAIGAPIHNEERSIIGVLVFEFNTRQIREWLNSTRLTKEGYVFVIDHKGSIVAHPLFNQNDAVTVDYSDADAVARAQSGEVYVGSYFDPYEQQDVIATLLPLAVGRNTWVVVAQQTASNAYADLNSLKRNIAIAGGILTLLTLMMVISLARTNAKNVRLNRELQTKNQALRETASIVSSSNDAIMGLRLNGTIRTWNAGAKRIYGYDEKEIIGHSIEELVPESQKNELNDILGKINEGQTVQHFETMHVRKDQLPIDVSLTVSPVADENGKVVGISGISRDISERKKVEQMKNDFISFVSHQLKAPVTAMKWVLEELFDGTYGALSEEVKKPLQQLQEVNENNHRLITDILNVSRIDRGVIAVDAKEVPLKEVAEQAARDYFKAAEKAGLTLTIVEQEKNIMVLADKDKMSESVSNSISNAIKHTKAGGITMTLRKDGKNGIIDVTDTGEGMPEEIRSKLFTRDQILGGSANAEKSAGLGLYIARNFMTLQKGDITVQSEQGKGTTFTYTIPLI